MAGLLIIAHQPLASALRTVAAHLYAEVQVMALDVPPDALPEQMQQQARQLLGMVRDPEALVLTDAYGSTPAGVAASLADGAQVRVITGVNVSMLWKAIANRAQPLETLVACALDGGAKGVQTLGVTPPQHQPARATNDDQVHTQHQQ
jgi:PTS system ascorbate-specific IIA component